jgi:hypothetical protein
MSIKQPRRKTAERYGVSVRTVERWEEEKEKTKFPSSFLINGRRYDDVEALDAWDDFLRRQALSATNRPQQRPPTRSRKPDDRCRAPYAVRPALPREGTGLG